MAALPHNIEKSAFRPREYVGYAGGVWRIRKTGVGGWEALERDGPDRIFGTTLQEIGEKLTAYDADSRKRMEPRDWSL